MPVNDRPRILAFDTSSVRGSIALLEGTALRAELKLCRLQNHSTNLIRSIDFLLNGLGWTLEELDLVASGIGPGSFTGIRIGISTGLGIAQSLSIPFAGITGLEAMAYQTVFLDGYVGVLLNAGREQFYYAEYRKNQGRMREIRKPSLEFLSDLPRMVKKQSIHLAGDTVLCTEGMFRTLKIRRPEIVDIDNYLAVSIGRRAMSVKRRWRSGNFIQCEPLYIRPPDAVKKRAGVR